MAADRTASKAEAAKKHLQFQRIDAPLLSTARALRHAYDAAFRQVDLSLPEASLLVYVDDAGPLTQARLAQMLDAGRAATGLRIDALERQHLVERRPDANDRRVWLVVTTDAGSARAEEVRKIDAAFAAQLRVGLTREERRQLADLLLRVRTNLKAMRETLVG